MILGMPLSTFTSVHVVLSLIGIVTGIVVLLGAPGARLTAVLTALFLLSTVATNVTGFYFPSTRIAIGHVLGAASLVVLGPTLLALYHHRLAGPWRTIYIGGATIALYLNAYIGVSQSFAKIPALHALALSPVAPAVLAAQLALLAIAVALGAIAAKRYCPVTPSRAFAIT